MKQKKEYIKNIDDFKEKFKKLNFEIENLFNDEKNKIFIDYILKNKEKIESFGLDFKFNTFFVDGSMSKIGNTFPHYYYIFRSLSYSPNLEIKIFMYDLFSPLIEEDYNLFKEKLEKLTNHKQNKKDDIFLNLSNINYVEESLRYVLMAKLEIEVTKESIQYLKNGDIVFMDGSLTHFKGECPEEFGRLIKICNENGILLCGIVEDIGSIIISGIFEDTPNSTKVHDKELLIGNLNEGEMLHIEKPSRKEGFSTTFLRLSKDPSPISFEVPNIWSYKYKEIASFLMFITERYGRGIPIFRDMSHEDVKLTDEEKFLISKNFIKSEYLEKLFKLKRWLR
ncbi:MAG: DNA double-strand break repair nuclease NurA [Caldisericia bacterium]|nr:DNA double-strand break repair nuclease NurA [Caldisericia bacterium]